MTNTTAAGQDILEWRRQLAVNPPQLQFDGRVAPRPGLIGCVPSSGGVYLFADLRGVLYIGRTEILRRRFGQHLDASHNTWLSGALRRPVGAAEFRWILAPATEQPALERYLIQTFRPLCNHAMNSI